jgi:hypothetical protein
VTKRQKRRPPRGCDGRMPPTGAQHLGLLSADRDTRGDRSGPRPGSDRPSVRRPAASRPTVPAWRRSAGRCLRRTSRVLGPDRRGPAVAGNQSYRALFVKTTDGAKGHTSEEHVRQDRLVGVSQRMATSARPYTACTTIRTSRTPHRSASQPTGMAARAAPAW